MRKYAFTGGILLVALAFYLFLRSPMATSPQQLTLIAGASAQIGGGRATMWFARPDEILAGGHIVSAAQVTLTCKGSEHPITLHHIATRRIFRACVRPADQAFEVG